MHCTQRMAHPARPDRRDQRVRKVPSDQLVLSEQREHKARQEQQVHKVLREAPVQPDPKATRVMPAQQGLKAQLGKLVPQAHKDR